MKVFNLMFKLCYEVCGFVGGFKDYLVDKKKWGGGGGL